jgi:hypothetical protein
VTRTPQDFQSGASPSAWLTQRSGPLVAMDEVLLVLRRASFAQLSRGLIADLPLAVVGLALYYLERVEGLRAPRLAFAVAFVLALWFRFCVLAGLAREFVSVLRPTLPLTAAAPSWAKLAASASVAALGLWLWAWPMLAFARLSVFALLAALPLVALRGALAPSYLARAACAEERGLGTFKRALDDTRGARASMLALEALVWGGFLTLFANLYGLGALGLALANSVLGLDVAFLSAFVSPDNEFVPLLLLSATALLFEPLRAALSALAFTEARGRNEGADLHAAIDALAPARSDNTAARPARSLSALLAFGLLLGGASALRAQAAPDGGYQGDASDRAVQARVKRILSRGEFHDFDAGDGDSSRIMDFIERWFGPHADAERLAPSPLRFELRFPPWLVVAVALLLLGSVLLYIRMGLRPADQPPPAAAVGSPPQPAAHLTPSAAGLGDAAALAQSGRYREALRALYSATLLSLDRARLIRFDASFTNGHYLRALPAGPTRQRFASFTQVFERAWYGHAPADQLDYEAARSLAEQLCQSAEQET